VPGSQVAFSYCRSLHALALLFPPKLSPRTDAVSPTPELPRPVVYTARGASLQTYLSSWLLATPGSPMRHLGKERWVGAEKGCLQISLRRAGTLILSWLLATPGSPMRHLGKERWVGAEKG
jgi:hypothetical protein